MKQREIHEVYLDPIIGSDQGGRRPAVIISGNLANSNLNTIIVCPLTAKLKNYHGNIILNPDKMNGLSQISEAMTIHVRSISKNRVKAKIGQVSKNEFIKIVESLDKIIKY